MSDSEQAIEYIFSDEAPDGRFRTEALETYKELKQRKNLREKKHIQDYRAFKGDMIRKSTRKKNQSRYSYGKAI